MSVFQRCGVAGSAHMWLAWLNDRQREAMGNRALHTAETKCRPQCQAQSDRATLMHTQALLSSDEQEEKRGNSAPT